MILDNDGAPPLTPDRAKVIYAEVQGLLKKYGYAAGMLLMVDNPMTVPDILPIALGTDASRDLLRRATLVVTTEDPTFKLDTVN